MTRQSDLQSVVLWLSKLALLSSGDRPPASKQQVGLYASLLVEEMPIGAFTDASLQAVVDGAERFPSYKVLKEALTTWHSQWGAQKGEAVSYGVSGYVVDRIMLECGGKPGPMLRNWLESKGVDIDAAGKTGDQAHADWSDPAKVRASVAKLAGHPMERALGNLLATAVARHAPDNLAFVPAEFHPQNGGTV